MITYVDSSNRGLYNTRFEQATAVLRANEVITSDSEITTLEEYFLYLRDLAQTPEGAYYTMLPVDEETFDIDANTRKINVPASFAKNGIGVQGDEIAEVVYFTIDRFFDATDLSDKSMNIAIQWETSNKIAGVSREFVRDISSRPGKLIFGWPLSSEITNNPGIVKFSVRFYKIGERTVTADNGQAVSQPYLTYNFNTLTAEAKINGSLDYDLHGKNTKLDIVNHNDLILSRIVNSVLTDPSIPNPGAPEWIINLADIATLEKIYGPVDEMPDDTEEEIAAKAAARAAADFAAKKYLVKDLQTLQETVVNGVAVPAKGYVMKAYAVGDGAISYNWLHSDIDANRNIASEDIPVSLVNNALYEPAEPGPRDPSRVYYVAEYAYVRDDEGHEVPDHIQGYKPYPLTDTSIVIDANSQITVNGTNITLYERHSTGIATSAGVYHVVAVNRRVGKVSSLDSYKIIIPMPYIPEILPEESENTVESSTGVEYNAVNEEENIIHVLLDRDSRTAELHVTAVSPEIAEAEAEDLPTPLVELTYQWYKADNNGLEGTQIYSETPDAGGMIADEYKITDALADSYEVSVSADDFANYDKVFYAKVINNRNLAQALKYSKPYRVTAAPEKPILLEPLGANYGGIKLLQKIVGQSVTLSTDIIHSDDETYQWYKVTLGDEEDVPEYEPETDILLEGETSATFRPEESGYYYCIMTNHLNGATNSDYTPFYNFVNP